MSGIVDQVCANVDGRCIGTRIRKKGCTVSLSGAPTARLIVDLDKPGAPLGQADVRCDYIFVAEDSVGSHWVVPLELTKQPVDASKFISQLQAGASAAERLVPRSAVERFRPIAVYGGGSPKAERLKLQRGHNRVRFHGMRELIRLIRCGAKMADQLR